jgi:hypothetical protein
MSFFLRASTKGELAAEDFESPVMMKMSFWFSFLRAMYYLSEIISSPDLEVW